MSPGFRTSVRVGLLVAVALVGGVFSSVSNLTIAERMATASSLDPHSPILIIGNTGFAMANGVRSGVGIASDPYVISNWQIEATPNGITIVNTSSYFTVQGVNVYSGLRGIYLYNVTNGIVQASTISNSTVGISVDQSESLTISNNIVSSPPGSAAQPFAGGIMVAHSTEVTILGNKVSSIPSARENDGVIIDASPSTIISNNNIWYSGSGIFLNDSAHALVTSNNLTLNSAVGIKLNNSPYVNIAANNLSHNLGAGISEFPSPGTSPNATIVSNTLYANGDGVSVSSSQDTISSNVVSYNTGNGISIFSYNSTVSQNTIAFNGGAGISCCNLRNTTLRDNIFTGDDLVLSAQNQPPYAPYVSLTITPDNIVNDRPILYYNGCSNLDINGTIAGELIAINCKNLAISKLELSNTNVGMQLINVNDTFITGNSVNSNNVGISMIGYSNITIVGNSLSNNGNGNLYPHSAGLYATGYYGSKALLIYHNNFFYDAAYVYPNAVYFDDGYPVGGNFWSSYNGMDNCSGSSQSICPSPDSIGDTPFRLLSSDDTAAVLDNYPLTLLFLPSPDTTPPGWLPSAQLVVTNVGENGLTLSWMKAADDVAVVSYRVYQGNTLLATVPANSLDWAFPSLPGYGYKYTVANLSAGATYTFKVIALDEGGNPSTSGLSATVKTFSTIPGSLWLQYWYLVTLAAGAGGVAVLLFAGMRLKRKKKSIQSYAPSSESFNQILTEILRTRVTLLD